MKYEIKFIMNNTDDPIPEIRRTLQLLIDQMIDGNPLPNRILRNKNGNGIGIANTYGTDNPEMGDPKKHLTEGGDK